MKALFCEGSSVACCDFFGCWSAASWTRCVSAVSVPRFELGATVAFLGWWSAASWTRSVSAVSVPRLELGATLAFLGWWTAASWTRCISAAPFPKVEVGVRLALNPELRAAQQLLPHWASSGLLGRGHASASSISASARNELEVCTGGREV